MKRMTLIGLTMLVCFLAAAPTMAAQSVTIKLAHSEKNENQHAALTNTFKEIIEKETNGRIKVQVFPNGQLGNLRSMLEQTQRGLIQATTAQSIGLLTSYYPSLQILETPFAFKNPEQIMKFFQTDFIQEMVEDFAKTKGVRLLAILPAGMRSFSNNVRPIVAPDDMRGLKMRVMEIPIYLRMVQSLGASPTPVAWEELYTALQTGVVDGQENAPYTMIMANVQEVQKYYTLDNHVGNIVTFSINEKFFQGLSDEEKKTVQRAAEKGAAEFVRIVEEKEEADIEFLATKMQITRLTDEQREKFAEKAMPSSIEYLRGEIGNEVVDRFLEELEKMD